MSAMNEVANWAKQESAKLEAEWPKGSQQEKDLIAYWRQNRPRMTAALLKESALAELAHVVLDDEEHAGRNGQRDARRAFEPYTRTWGH